MVHALIRPMAIACALLSVTQAWGTTMEVGPNSLAPSGPGATAGADNETGQALVQDFLAAGSDWAGANGQFRFTGGDGGGYLPADSMPDISLPRDGDLLYRHSLQNVQGSTLLFAMPQQDKLASMPQSFPEPGTLAATSAALAALGGYISRRFRIRRTSRSPGA